MCLKPMVQTPAKANFKLLIVHGQLAELLNFLQSNHVLYPPLQVEPDQSINHLPISNTGSSGDHSVSLQI